MASTVKHPKISAYMNSLLDEYRHLRGQPKDSGIRPFWDVVVVTASDPSQQTAYQLQIDEKTARGELPTDLPIHVVSDPPGVRIGNGGSTLECLEFLHEKYGAKLFESKVLLIHAGGWSQRMPSATALGKVFSILPHGTPPFQMLDLKLALYWPLVGRMAPGVFIVCADDFVVFDLDEKGEWEIPGKGFTALAHPAPLQVGKSHGVFVLADPDSMDTSEPVSICECVKVLQKPSECRMKSEGALLKGDSFLFGDGIRLEGDVVYTDSCFYFGVDVMRKMIDLKQTVGRLSCEIDAYGDFLQAVGKNATNDYIKLTFNVSQPTPNLLEMRQKVFDALTGSDMHVLVLNSSKFIHIGTTKELLCHFCRDEEFQEQLCMGRDVFNTFHGVEKNGKSRNSNSSQQSLPEDGNGNASRRCNAMSENACTVHCSLHAESSIASDCFLEFCHFELPITISSNCILSNCQVLSHESSLTNVFIPSHTFIHTIPINQDGCTDTKYVTIFFRIDDDLKKSTCVKYLGGLPFLGSDIDNFLSQCGMEAKHVLPGEMAANLNGIGLKGTDADKDEADLETKSSNCEDQKVSLWNLKLYKAHDSMSLSLQGALSMINWDDHPSGPKPKKPKGSHKLFSLAELLRVKNVSAMLNFRRALYETITNQIK